MTAPSASRTLTALSSGLAPSNVAMASATVASASVATAAMADTAACKGALARVVQHRRLLWRGRVRY